MCVSVCYLCVGAIRGQKTVLDTPELERQEDVMPLMWVIWKSNYCS